MYISVYHVGARCPGRSEPWIWSCTFLKTTRWVLRIEPRSSAEQQVLLTTELSLQCKKWNIKEKTYQKNNRFLFHQVVSYSLVSDRLSAKTPNMLTTFKMCWINIFHDISGSLYEALNMETTEYFDFFSEFTSTHMKAMITVLCSCVCDFSPWGGVFTVLTVLLDLCIWFYLNWL